MSFSSAKCARRSESCELKSKRQNSIVKSLYVTVLSLAMICPAIGGLKLASAADDTTTLTIGFDQSIDSLNPFIGVNDNAYVFYGLVYDYLICIDEDLVPKPNLATSWNIVRDIEPVGSVWQYNLTHDAYWHDGEEFTADDVVFTFEYQTGENWVNMWAYQPYTILISEIEKVDTYTVRLHFADFEGRPAACSFGHSLMMPMVPKHVWQDVNPSEAGFSYPNYFPIGTGPFMCTESTKSEYLQGDRLILYKNPDYHGGEVQFDRLIIEFYLEPTAMATDLENGNIDLAAFDAATYDSLRSRLASNPNDNIETFSGLKCTAYSIEIATCMVANNMNNLRLDPAVRLAMAHATNKTYIMEYIYKGLAMKGSALLSPMYDYWYWEPSAEEEYQYDIDLANDILDAAGYVWQGDWRVAGPGNAWAPAGERLAFEMTIEEELFEDRLSGAYLKEEWKKIGIDITLDIVSSGLWGTKVYGAAYDLTITYWSGDPDPNYLLYVTSSFALEGWSESFYSNPEYDENYTEQLLEVDPVKRLEYVFNCQKLLYRDNAMIVTVYPNGNYAWRLDHFANWGDWEAHPGRSLSNFWTGNDLFFDLEPLEREDDGGGSTALVLGIAVVAVAVVAGLAFYMMKKRGGKEEEEVRLP